MPKAKNKLVDEAFALYRQTMQKFAEEHAAEIEQKKAELKEGGWYE